MFKRAKLTEDEVAAREALDLRRAGLDVVMGSLLAEGTELARLNHAWWDGIADAHGFDRSTPERVLRYNRSVGMVTNDLYDLNTEEDWAAMETADASDGDAQA